jgi:hypothetical protein
MSEAWLNFSIVILVQFTLFVLFAIFQKRLSSTPTILVHGLIIGTVIGFLYDLILGKYFGLFSYSLGFDTYFLIINATLAYGIFVASVLLLQKVNIVYFVFWLSLLIMVYETANYYFPVWTYEFTLPLLPFLILLLVGHSSGAFLASLVANRFFNYQFVIEMNTVKKLE